MCDLDVTGGSSIFKKICSVVSLGNLEYFHIQISAGRRTPHGDSGTDHCWIVQAEFLKMQKSGQFPDELVKIEATQSHYVVSRTY
jgi:hypothetical protein